MHIYQAPFGELELAALTLTMVDFQAALSRVQPSAKREGFATTPEVTWADVGALTDVRRELEDAISYPLLRPDLAMRVDAPPSTLHPHPHGLPS